MSLMPATPRFMGLPIELTQKIIRYVRKSSDLNVLSQASTSISAEATPLLYKNLVLDPKDNLIFFCRSIQNVSTSENLRFVRILQIKPSKLSLFDEEENETSLLLEREDQRRLKLNFEILISNLECNSLERFDYSLPFQFGYEDLIYIHSRQKNIRNFTYKDQSYPATNHHGDLISEDHPSLHCNNFTELHFLHTNFGKIAEILPVLAPSRCILQPRFSQITHLYFEHCGLFADRQRLPLDEFSSLISLTFEDCEEESTILAGYIRPTLKHLRILSVYPDSMNTAGINETISLLGRFRGLTSFAISISHRVDWFPETILRSLTGAVALHKDTLKNLAVEDAAFIFSIMRRPRDLLNRQIWDSQAGIASVLLLTLAKKCAKLSELEVALTPNNMIEEFKDLIAHLPHLTTLSISVGASICNDKHYFDKRNQIIKQYSDILMQIAIDANSKLTLLVWPIIRMEAPRTCYLRLPLAKRAEGVTVERVKEELVKDLVTEYDDFMLTPKRRT